MIKLLPISYPHQCTYRDGVSKRYCNFQGRCFGIVCQGHWNEFPVNCPLESAKNSDNSEVQKPAHNKALESIPPLSITGAANTGRFCALRSL